MDLKTRIYGIKNIEYCEFVIPVEKGIYCLAGTNGCGKSTVLSCVAQAVFSSSLQNLSELDYGTNSKVEFEYNGHLTTWENKNNAWSTNCKKLNRIHFNGIYEGSLFYGTRFDDSLVVDTVE